MKNTYLHYLNIAVTAIFVFLSIQVLSDLSERVLHSLLIITLPVSLINLWLPKLVGVFVFVVLLYLSLNKLKIVNKLDFRKLKKTTLLFFVSIWLLYFGFIYAETSLFFEPWLEKYKSYQEIRMNNLNLFGVLELNHFVKYILFAAMIYLKSRKANYIFNEKA